MKNEAAEATARRLRVSALRGRVKLPLEFRRGQAADLVAWGGNTNQERFQALCSGVEKCSLSSRSLSNRSTTADAGLHLSRVFSVGRVVLIMGVLFVFVASSARGAIWSLFEKLAAQMVYHKKN